MKPILSSAFCLLLTTQALATDVVSDTIIQEVVTTGTRNLTDIRQLPFTVSVLDRDLLTASHHTSVLPTLAQEVPGLFITSRGVYGYGVAGGQSGTINLRGISSSSGQLLVLIDGHPQYQGIYGHSIADSYQTMLADRVEVLRGPASVLYGSNAMGGVVNIITRQNPKDDDSAATKVTVGAGSYGTLQAEASSQVRSGRFSSTVAAQYGRSDNHRPHMGFEQYGGYVKLGYDFSQHWNAFVDANLTHFNASQPGAVSSPLYDADQWITRGVVSATVENHYDHTSGALSVFSNFGRHKIDDGTSDPAKPTQRYFRSKDALTGFNWYQSAQLFAGNRVTVGLDYMNIYGHAFYTSKETGDVLDTPNKQSGRSYRNEVAGYADFRQDLMDWMTIDLGARLDHHSITGTEFVPQAGLVFRLSPNKEAKAMVSKGFRNPTMREMYLYPPSNTDLKPERLWNYELSWLEHLDGFTYGLNIFYIKGDNIIQQIPVNGKPRLVNTGEIENWGIETEVKYPMSRYLSSRANVSYLHMKNKVVAAPEYTTFVGVDYRCNRWFATIGLQHVGNLYTAIGNAEKKEDFWLLNASATYRLNRTVSFWTRGENLLAQRYEINDGFPMPKATFMGGVTLDF